MQWLTAIEIYLHSFYQKPKIEIPHWNQVARRLGGRKITQSIFAWFPRNEKEKSTKQWF